MMKFDWKSSIRGWFELWLPPGNREEGALREFFIRGTWFDYLDHIEVMKRFEVRAIDMQDKKSEQ